MGSLRNSDDQHTRLQQARLEALARLWESQLESARLFFHDQIVRNDVLAALEHPEDWSDWRMKNKFDAIQSAWAKEDGIPRGFVVITADNRIHTVAGDTSGFAEADLISPAASGADMVLLGPIGSRSALLLMQYCPVSTDEDNHPARAVIFVDAASLVSNAGDVPDSWALLSAPSDALLSSSSAHLNTSVSKAAWPLLISEKAGAVPQSSGGTLCFVTVHVPGMEPLLLIESVASHRSAAAWLIFALLALGTATLIVAARTRAPMAAQSPASVSRPVAETSTSDSAGFRQIFQTLADPLCVIDPSGQVTRANHTAQEWLRLNKGKPDGNMNVHLAYGEMTVFEYLAKAVEDPAAASGLCRFTFGELSACGDVTVSRLSRDRDEEGRGPVLVHFHPQPEPPPKTDERAYMPPETTRPELVQTGHDSHCPFPVLSVTSGGLITSFNEAARHTCPALEDTPLLSEILTGLDSRDVPSLLNSTSGSVFESLFGSSLHQFEMVHAENQILLYAHRLSASKQLEVELKQTQENFYTLCALSPTPVMLVDPRDRVILEANAAAADLFGFTPVDLRGQAVDALTAEPWDFAAGEELYVAASTCGQATRCLFRYELIKIEGMPTLLVVLEPLLIALSPRTEPVSAVEQETGEMHALTPPPLPPPLPLGPGLLITLNPTVREVARRLLEKTGHPCEVFSSLDDATVWLITHDIRPELAVIDLTDFDDAESWIEELRVRCGDVPCVAFTDGADYDLPNGGLNEFLPKPFDLDSLSGTLATLHLETSVCESSL